MSCDGSIIEHSGVIGWISNGSGAIDAVSNLGFDCWEEKDNSRCLRVVLVEDGSKPFDALLSDAAVALKRLADSGMLVDNISIGVVKQAGLATCSLSGSGKNWAEISRLVGQIEIVVYGD